MKSPEKNTLWFGAWPEKAKHFFHEGWGRWAGLAGLCAAVALWGVVKLWDWAYPRLAVQSHYRWNVKDVELTPAPAWVPGDLKAEVLRDNGLQGPVSLLDPDLTRRISHAFSLHPWVRYARSTKSPGGVRVEIEYRRPVMFVEVGTRWEPVDIDGVLLPQPKLSDEQQQKMPRFTGLGTTPAGPAGTSWGDPRVAAAASIADFLAEDWPNWKLSTLEPAPPTFTESIEVELFYLYSSSRRTRIIWGRSLLHPSSDEPPAAEKLKRLRQFFSQHHTFDPSTPQDLDLRPLPQLQVSPRITHLQGEESLR